MMILLLMEGQVLDEQNHKQEFEVHYEGNAIIVNYDDNDGDVYNADDGIHNTNDGDGNDCSACIFNIHSILSCRSISVRPDLLLEFNILV